MPPIVDKERFTISTRKTSLQTSTGTKDLHPSTGYTGLLEFTGCTDLWTSTTRRTGLLELTGCVGLMHDTTLQIFGRDIVFNVKIVGAFKMDTQGTEVRFNYMDTWK